MQRLWQFVNLFLTADADAFAASLYDVSCIEVHLFWLQLQVATEVVIHLLHHASPFRIPRVCLALMHEDTLDDTIFLSLLGQRDQTLIGIVVVRLKHTLHPVRCFLQIGRNAIGKETFDVNAANGHVDDTDFDILGQRSHQSTAKPVGRRQTGIRTTQGWNGFVPFTHLTGWKRFCCGVVYCRHPQEAWPGTLEVLSLRTGCALHIGLTKAQEDIKIRILRVHACGAHEKNGNKQLFHVVCYC